MTSVQRQYDAIASIYDLLAEGDDGMINFRINAMKELEPLDTDARVLDCSCGTGSHAIWLARQGYRVYASDISAGMLDRARHKASREKLDITFFQSSWKELPDNTSMKFDLACCPGNSLSHLESLDMLAASFKGIRQVVAPGRSFIFDTRNWEKTFTDNSLHNQDFRVKGKQGIFDVSYSYEIKGWNKSSKMYVDIRPADTKKLTRFEFDFLPAGFDQYNKALRNAGFGRIEQRFFPGNDYYFVVAV